jgi:predicted ATPase/DNA-binding SARP family transcriptional activator
MDNPGGLAPQIALLGPLQVRDQTGALVPIGGRQLRVLLSMLALQPGRVVSAGTLASGLWPDEQPADPGNALQTLVSRLRSALRPAGCAALIESHPAGYLLAVPPKAVDVAAFRDIAREGRRALAGGDARTAARLLREALALWRGRPLADAEGFEFADNAAIGLSELREEAARDRIEADLALGEGASLVGELKAMVSADPLAERPRALLMRALCTAGRQAEALAVYGEARDLLADELGVDPSPALEQVYLRILRGEEHTERPAVPLPGTLAPTAVPAPLTTFVGRDDEVSRLVKLLREATRLVTLTGAGGVGKTRLVTEIPGRIETRACFVALAPVSDPADVPYAVLDALGIRGPVIGRRAGEPGSAADQVCAALADRDSLLILDNCEHVVEAAAVLAGQILATCPRVTIIATSREPLRIDGETLFPVTPLPVPPLADLTPEIYPAVRLLCDRAAAVQPGFRLDEEGAQAAARICRQLDGMPLAIELAAPWLRVLSPAQLAERLDDRFTLLTGGSRTAMPRHQTLRAVVDWSWELLSEPERTLARRISVFPGGATLTAAERVCAGDDLPPGHVLATLSGLVGKSILGVTDGPEGTGPRYQMLETVRAYCLERLSQAGEARRVRDGFSGYYLDLAETADPLLRRAGQRAWLRQIGAEQDNIYAAIRWLIASRDTQAALRFIRALGWYWLVHGQAGEPMTLAGEVLALGPGGDTLPMAEARIICVLTAAGPDWDFARVRPHLDAATTALERWAADRPAFHPIAALAEPVLALLDRNAERALMLLDTLTLAKDPWLTAAASMLRTSFAWTLGTGTGAEEENLRVALAGFRNLGEAWGTAGALLQLAQLSDMRGDHEAAIAGLVEAAIIGGELGAWGDLPQIDGLLARVRLRMGDLAGAREDLDRADRAEAGMAAGRTDAAAWLGRVRAELYWRAGDRERAIQQCEDVLSTIAGKKVAWYDTVRALIMARLALLSLEGGDRARARVLLADALRASVIWVDHIAIGEVVDAVAVFLLDDPVQAATVLGVAHAVRGEFDEGGLDGTRARQAAREALGPPDFEDAYQRGRNLGSSAGLLLVSELVGAGLTEDQVRRR